MTKLKILFTFCAIVSFHQLSSQEILFNAHLIPQELMANCNAVVQYDDVEVFINSQTSLDYTVRKAVTVKNDHGDSNSLIRVGFDKNQKILDIKAYVYDQNGKEIKKIKRRDFNDVSSSDGFSLYSDSRMLYYDYTPIAYPYTIVYEYSVSSNSTGFIPTWYPVPGYLTSVRSSSYVVYSKEELGLRSKSFNFEGFGIEEISNTSKVVSYKVSNIPAVKYEPSGLNFTDYFPFLRVALDKFSLEGIEGEAADWNTFGMWQKNFLLQGKDVLPDAVISEMKALVAHTDDPVEKARIVYKYMQDRTRYISVQVGIGGWMPFPAQEVHHLGYSDCKGLTNYTKALLDAVGVTSHYTVLYAGDEIKSIDSEFHSMQGNHVILNLPTDEGDIWLECTSQKVPFGFIAGFTDDRDVLVITPEGGIIKHTKKYSAEDSGQFTKGTYTVNFKGRIEAELEIATTGYQYDSHVGYYVGESPKDQETTIKNYFDHISNIDVENFEFKNDIANSVFNEQVKFSADNYASYSGNQLIVVANAFNRNGYVPRRIRNRKIPIDLERGYLDTDEVEIHLPISMKVEYVPEKVNVETEFGTYSLEFEKVEAHKFIYKRTLKMNGGKYDASKYEAYRKFRRNISKYDNSKIILTKNQL